MPFLAAARVRPQAERKSASSPRRDRFVLWLAGLAASLVVCGARARADENERAMPALKFFYYDSAKIEWIVSAEPERLQDHFQTNAESARLFHSLSSAVDEQADLEQVRAQMARWLDNERGRVTEPRGNVVRLRMAEGISAYLRAHEFSMDQLVEALLKHSGASGVEIAAIHLVDGSGTSTFRLKVMLPDESIGIGGQGFNVAFQSPDITYTGVVYALALALYEVQEIVNSDAEEGAPSSPDLDVESLPTPEPSGPFRGDGPPPDRAAATRRS